MIAAFSRAVSDMMSRTLLLILAKSAALTVALFVMFGAAAFFMLDWLDLLEGRFLASFDFQLAGIFYALAALLFVVIGMWALFRVVMIAVIGLFADDIIKAVEARHYPDARGSGPGIVQSGGLVLRSLWRLFWANLLTAPLYLLLLVTGAGPAIAFLLVNGWAFGRDLDDAMRVRFAMPGTAAAISPVSRFLLGTGATFATGLPLVQIVVPVFAVAMATHLAHDSRR